MIVDIREFWVSIDVGSERAQSELGHDHRKRFREGSSLKSDSLIASRGPTWGCTTNDESVSCLSPPHQMPVKSSAILLLEKADKKANSSTGWFNSVSTKFEEAGDLYQQAANAFKLDKLFREAGDAFAREAECREKCEEWSEAANAWWNASKAYKRGHPERVYPVVLLARLMLMSFRSCYRSPLPDNKPSN